MIISGSRGGHGTLRRRQLDPQPELDREVVQGGSIEGLMRNLSINKTELWTVGVWGVWESGSREWEAKRREWGDTLLTRSRLKIEEDAKIPNAATFTLKKQDHTLGNMIRS